MGRAFRMEAGKSIKQLFCSEGEYLLNEGKQSNE
jgi:hypothetical protein